MAHSRQLGFRHTKFSESQHFVLCSDLRTARSVVYTGLILRETQLQLPVTASNKSTQHTYHTLRCRGPLRTHTPLYRGVRKGKTRDFATVSFRECEPSRQFVNRGNGSSPVLEGIGNLVV